MKIGEVSVSAVIDTATMKPGAQATIAEVKRVQMEIQRVEASLAKLKALGKQNTPWFRENVSDLKRLKAELTQLEGVTKSVFRTKNLDLARDLTVISFGARQVINDFGDVRDELGKTDISAGRLAGSVGNATLSFLAMIPALKALNTALPAPFASGIASVGKFSAVTTGVIATLVVTIGGLVRAILNVGTAWDSVKRIFSGANLLDLWIEKTAQLSMGMIDFRSEVDKVGDSVYGLGAAFDWLKSKVQEALNINLDKYRNSNAFVSKTFEEMKTNTATLNDLNQTLVILQKEQNNATGDKLKLINQGIEQTKKQIDQQQKLGVNTSNRKGPGRVNSPRIEKEDLNFLEDYQKKLAGLRDDESELKGLLAGQNLEGHERLYLTEKLASVVKQINEMMGNVGIDISSKMGDLVSLTAMVQSLPDAMAKKSWKGGGTVPEASEQPEDLDMSFARWMQMAQEINSILNQPLDNPLQTMMAILKIAQQVAMFMNGGDGSGFGQLLGGALSFLGPVGGIIGSIFGGIFGGMPSGSGSGASGSMVHPEMSGMISNFNKTGHFYDLPAPFLIGGQASPVPAAAGTGGSNFYFEGRLIDNNFIEEIATKGVILKSFREQKIKKS